MNDLFHQSPCLFAHPVRHIEPGNIDRTTIQTGVLERGISFGTQYVCKTPEAANLILVAEVVVKMRVAMKATLWEDLDQALAEAFQLEVRGGLSIPEVCKTEIAAAQEEAENHRVAEAIQSALRLGRVTGEVGHINAAAINFTNIREALEAGTELLSKKATSMETSALLETARWAVDVRSAVAHSDWKVLGAVLSDLDKAMDANPSLYARLEELFREEIEIARAEEAFQNSMEGLCNVMTTGMLTQETPVGTMRDVESAREREVGIEIEALEKMVERSKEVVIRYGNKLLRRFITFAGELLQLRIALVSRPSKWQQLEESLERFEDLRTKEENEIANDRIDEHAARSVSTRGSSLNGLKRRLSVASGVTRMPATLPQSAYSLVHDELIRAKDELENHRLIETCKVALAQGMARRPVVDDARLDFSTIEMDTVNLAIAMAESMSSKQEFDGKASSERLRLGLGLSARHGIRGRSSSYYVSERKSEEEQEGNGPHVQGQQIPSEMQRRVTKAGAESLKGCKSLEAEAYVTTVHLVRKIRAALSRPHVAIEEVEIALIECSARQSKIREEAAVEIAYARSFCNDERLANSLREALGFGCIDEDSSEVLESQEDGRQLVHLNSAGCMVLGSSLKKRIELDGKEEEEDVRKESEEAKIGTTNAVVDRALAKAEELGIESQTSAILVASVRAIKQMREAFLSYLEDNFRSPDLWDAFEKATRQCDLLLRTGRCSDICAAEVGHAMTLIREKAVKDQLWSALVRGGAQLESRPVRGGSAFSFLNCSKVAVDKLQISLDTCERSEIPFSVNVQSLITAVGFSLRLRLAQREDDPERVLSVVKEATQLLVSTAMSIPMVTAEELRAAEVDAENRLSCRMLINAMTDGGPKESNGGAFLYAEDANVAIVTAIEHVQTSFRGIGERQGMYGSCDKLFAIKTSTLVRTAKQLLELRQAYNRGNWGAVATALSSLNTSIQWISAAKNRGARSSVSFDDDEELSQFAACEVVLDEAGVLC